MKLPTKAERKVKHYGQGRKADVDLEWRRAPASVWNKGDSIFGYEIRKTFSAPFVRYVYTAVLLVKRHGDYRLMACIEGPSWKSICDVYAELGFERPSFTAAEIRIAS